MKRTLIAAAVLSVAGVAQAHPGPDPYLYNGTEVAESVWITGFFGIYGCVSVDNSAGAVVNNNQTADLNHVKMSPTAQNYLKGKVTTSIDSTSAWNNVQATGHSWLNKSSSYSASVNAWENSKQTESQSNYASINAYGGYGYNTHSGTFDTTYQGSNVNAGGVVAAGAAGGFEASGGHTNHSVWGQAAGGFIAGFALSGYENSSTVNASSNNNWGSGSGYLYGAIGTYQTQTDTQSSSFHAGIDAKSQSHNSADWGFYSNWADQYGWTNVSGAVTQYYDTQAPATAEASIGNNALAGAQGNIGVNITTGIDNAQSNNASLASIDAGKTFGNAQVFSNQMSKGKGEIDNYNLISSVGDNALQYATGNVGVNVSSGVGNVQNNSLALVSSTPKGKYSQGGALVATDDSTQDANAQITGTFNASATLGSYALQGATGNVGVNIASGGGNLQHNGLAVASIKSGM